MWYIAFLDLSALILYSDNLLGVFILTWTRGEESEGKVVVVSGRRATSTSAVRTITMGTPLVVLDDPVVSPVSEPEGT